MIASLWKILTDHEGESTISFKVPLSELANVVRLNALIQRELNIEITENVEHRPDQSND